ncbi:protein phosphatase, putative [Hepatocystis sp. ex Piliocolobus tephrosceles]|nr:protein phosphatase, putative [Hepatocystis sp. ex Piliocolobus tephrosceles]
MLFLYHPLLIISLNNILFYENQFYAYGSFIKKIKRKMTHLIKKYDSILYRHNYGMFLKELKKNITINKNKKNEFGIVSNVFNISHIQPNIKYNTNVNNKIKKCDVKIHNTFSKEMKTVIELPYLFLKNNLSFNYFNVINNIYIKYKLKKNNSFLFNKKYHLSTDGVSPGVRAENRADKGAENRAEAEGTPPIMPNRVHSYLTNYKIIKHPDKTESEDCCINGQGFIAIADGVGSWIKYGVNPRKYPEKLLQLIQEKINENKNTKIEELLNYAYTNNHTEGSTTLCLILFNNNNNNYNNNNNNNNNYNNNNNNNNTISTAVIGDSQFIIIRNNNIIYKSKSQQYEFNFPYQLGSNAVSNPSDAHIEHIEVKKNDIIVAGTDGLWDNLYDHQVLELVKENNFSNLSDKIAAQSFSYSKMKRWKSPFINNYNKEFNCHKTGGKMDDITVSCALVC